MVYGGRRWLAGLGVAVAAGATVLGQAADAGATTTARSAKAGSAARADGNPAVAAIPPGYLGMGSHGPKVLALQKRLSALHYYLGKADGKFGWHTMEAVWAFKEVQARRRTPKNPDIVGPNMWHQLKHPKLPKVLYPHGGTWRVEVNKNTEVLVVYKDHKITLISHVSTAAWSRPDGTGFVTPDGKYHAQIYVKGCVPDATYGGCMYNPVFFIGTSYAIHGMPNPPSTFSFDGVPLNPASHGCVRVPMDVSVIFHTKVHVSQTKGTPIYIYGNNRN
jgi:peptidoglycan hydrolase-like protein with peptidoglycan-binding domain